MERNGGSSSTSLAPGFRFHPTDEELVFYYLRRKVSGKPFRFDAISDIDVYKCEPWDLPGLSKLKSRDLEWYFFSNLDKKYGNGSRTNRATIEGYWKTTGKDRPVQHRSRVVGMKKTLVYHRGRAPRGERSNWVMHEYKLADDELENTNVPQESFVLCRIFHKSGSGPKNGEKYGAPFVEEEWEEDDPLEVAGKPASDDSMTNGSVTEGSCHNQEHAMETPMKYPTPLLTCYEGDSSNVTETLAENELNSSTMVNEEQKSYPLPGQLEEAFNNDYVTQPTNISSQAPINYLPVEQCFDNANSAPLDEVLFLEADDLLQPIEENSSDFQLLDEYLQYFDADNDIEQRMAFDPSDMLDVDNILYDQSFLPDQNVDQSNMQPFKSYQQLPEPYSIESASFSEQVMVAQKSKPDHDVGQYLPFESSYMLGDFDSILYDQAFLLDQNLDQGDKQISAVDQHIPEAYSASTASSSGQITEAQNLKPDSKYSFMKRASEMLGNFPTHPAFASEFPTKEMSTKLDAAMKFSESVDLRPGIARDGEVSAKENGVCWSLDKCGNVNVILSFIVPEGIVNPVGIEAVTGIISRKMTSVISRRWPYFLFFSGLALCISSKVGTCI